MSQVTDSNHELEVFKKDRTILSEINECGRIRFNSAVPRGYLTQFHQDILEACYFISGTAEWYVQDRVYQLRRGDLFVVQPNEIHGGVDETMHRCDIYYVHVRLPLGMSHNAQALSKRLLNIKACQFEGSEFTHRGFEKLIEVHRNPKSFAKMLAACLLRELLIGVVHDYELHESNIVAKERWSIATKKAVELIHSEIASPHTLRSLADAARVSERHLVQRFTKEIGMTPAEYLIHLRIEEAKKLLLESAFSITDIGLTLGFSSGQHFATAFRIRTGFSPRSYKKQKLQS